MANAAEKTDAKMSSKSLFNKNEENALKQLQKSLSKVNPDNISEISTVIRQLFWPQNLNNAIPLLDAISKLNPKFKQRMDEGYPNQIQRQIRLRWTQADRIYCLAFEIPNSKGYYLAKVGMTATTGEYSKKDNKTYSRFEDLQNTFKDELSRSTLGPMKLSERQPNFKFLVSPYDVNDVQTIESRSRESLGWVVKKSVMKHYKISVHTEWIIIPPSQAKCLYDKVFEKNQSTSIELLDTRLLDGLPKLRDSEKKMEFTWTREETNENITFKPFEDISSSTSLQGSNNSTESSTSGATTDSSKVLNQLPNALEKLLTIEPTSSSHSTESKVDGTQQTTKKTKTKVKEKQ